MNGLLGQLLAGDGRTAEAERVFDDFVARHPDQREDMEAAAVWRRKPPGPAATTTSAP